MMETLWGAHLVDRLDVLEAALRDRKMEDGGVWSLALPMVLKLAD